MDPMIVYQISSESSDDDLADPLESPIDPMNDSDDDLYVISCNIGSFTTRNFFQNLLYSTC